MITVILMVENTVNTLIDDFWYSEHLVVLNV